MALTLHPVSPAGDLPLRAALRQADSLSHEAFSEILMLARCALVALSGPEGPRVADATRALQAIAWRAGEAENDINALAESADGVNLPLFSAQEASHV